MEQRERKPFKKLTRRYQFVRGIKFLVDPKISIFIEFQINIAYKLSKKLGSIPTFKTSSIFLLKKLSLGKVAHPKYFFEFG
jgi:hypothetical protein